MGGGGTSEKTPISIKSIRNFNFISVYKKNYADSWKNKK